MHRIDDSFKDPQTFAAMYPYGTGIFISVKLDGMALFCWSRVSIESLFADCAVGNVVNGVSALV